MAMSTETEPSPLVVRPIGVVRSPFQKQEGTPIQPYSARDTEGIVEIAPAFRDALLDVEGFERIWLIYWFDRSRPADLRVVPYRDTQAHGLFATRVPARINPVGMSPVRVLSVDGCRIRVGEIDILDGTPLLDIKPYVPRYDAYPDARAGWLDRPGLPTDPMRADNRFSRG